MRIHEACLPCIVSQAVKVAAMTGVEDRETLYRQLFAQLSQLDFNKTNPEVIGSSFGLIKQLLNNPDPYLKLRNQINDFFLSLLPDLQLRIDQSEAPLQEALALAVLANVIDFNPVHAKTLDQMLEEFDHQDQRPWSIDQRKELILDVKQASSLLIVGDNCGELCVDKLLIRKLKTVNPELKVYYGVRGVPVVNDSIEADAYRIGMDEEAQIISNGDDSLGTVLNRTSAAFQAIWNQADVVLAKGQANYESLSDEQEKCCYFLLTAKCKVIAGDIGVPQGTRVCMKR